MEYFQDNGKYYGIEKDTCKLYTLNDKNFLVHVNDKGNIAQYVVELEASHMAEQIYYEKMRKVRDTLLKKEENLKKRRFLGKFEECSQEWITERLEYEKNRTKELKQKINNNKLDYEELETEEFKTQRRLDYMKICPYHKVDEIESVLVRQRTIIKEKIQEIRNNKLNEKRIKLFGELEPFIQSEKGAMTYNNELNFGEEIGNMPITCDNKKYTLRKYIYNKIYKRLAVDGLHTDNYGYRSLLDLDGGKDHKKYKDLDEGLKEALPCLKNLNNNDIKNFLRNAKFNKPRKEQSTIKNKAMKMIFYNINAVGDGSVFNIYEDFGREVLDRLVYYGFYTKEELNEEIIKRCRESNCIYINSFTNEGYI